MPIEPYSKERQIGPRREKKSRGLKRSTAWAGPEATKRRRGRNAAEFRRCYGSLKRVRAVKGEPCGLRRQGCKDPNGKPHELGFEPEQLNFATERTEGTEGNSGSVGSVPSVAKTPADRVACPEPRRGEDLI